jgi:hypothetical protein
MSQRASGYARRADEEYPTPRWVAGVVGNHLRKRALHIWEPAAGNTALAGALRDQGYRVVATADDFFLRSKLPHDGIQAIVTNPPYGEDKRGRVAADFIRHALSFGVDVAMLLRVDFDSAKTRVDLFRDNKRFAGKVVLLDRVKWFDGPSSPSDNHAWFLWNRESGGAPWIRYIAKTGETWDEMWSRPLALTDAERRFE